jgi:phosphoglycerol transferase MdoB-like AlkP superfamily enzyme
MRQLFTFLLKFTIFWLLFFLLQRIIFFAYNYSSLGNIESTTLFLSSWYGLKYDLAVIGYIIILPFLLVSIHGFRNIPRLEKFFFIYSLLFIAAFSIIGTTDLALYGSWGTRINNKALNYLSSPGEVMASTLSVPLFPLLSFLGLQCAAGILLVKRFLPEIQGFRLKAMHLIIFTLIFVPVLVISLRGGIERKPITKAWGYFSKHSVANYAAINGPWNLVYTATHPVSSTNNPYSCCDPEEANSVVKALHGSSSHSSPKLFSSEKPNIVMIVLESWSADVIAELGGEPGITPNFSKLCSEGLLFTNFYASGNRTEQGLAALLSGFPAQPKTSILRDFGKFEKLPSLVAVLDSAGYFPAAYYGTNLTFANTGPYFSSMGFRKIYGENDIPYHEKTLWGIHDEETLNFQLHDLKNLEQPFFVIAPTVSSHEPFDAPGPAAFPGNQIEQKYRNAVHYTDKCLGEYFEKARLEPWYPNTIFILVADHAHIYPKNRADDEPARYHIPFLLYGPALKPEARGKTIDVYSSQTDFANTLLGQFGMKSASMRWSRNLMNVRNEDSFAFYTFEDGFGWLSSEKRIVVDNPSGKLLRQENADSITIRKGKMYLQVLFDEYLKY